MAESVKVVDPDSGTGYDYDSLYDWEAAQQSDIDSSGTIAVAKCRCTGGTADTTAVTIDGWTVSATQYFKIWTDPAESYRHLGKLPTSGNYYRIVAAVSGDSGGAPLDNTENYAQILGLAIHNTYSTSGDHNPGVLRSTGTNCLIGFGVFRMAAGSDYPKGVELNSNTIILNSIVYDAYPVGTGTAYGYGVRRAANAVAVRCYNVTVQNCRYGFLTLDDGVSAANQLVVINCLTAGCATGFLTNWQFGTGSDYNASSVASDAPGDNSRNGQTFTFVDVDADDFHLASNDEGALGYGLNLYNDANYPFQDDIDGQDRGGAAAAWDIGADEYVSAAATIEQEGFRFRNDDGDEDGATWKANQDVNITLAADTAARIRMLLNATGDPDSIGAQLEYRYKPSGGAFGSWTKVN